MFLSMCHVQIEDSVIRLLQKGGIIMMTQENIGKFIAEKRKENNMTQVFYHSKIVVQYLFQNIQ